MQNTVLIQKYETMLKSTIVPTNQQLMASFKQVHTRHILISNQTHPDAQAKAQAVALIQQLQAGADFKKLVQEYSDDTASKPSGGDDGVINSNTQYVPEFLNAALQLNAGQITPAPVYSPQYGYFIIQALSTKESIPADFAKNKSMYEQQLAQKMQQTAEQSALSAASQTAIVTITDPLLSGYRALSSGNPGPSQISTALADFQKALTTADYSDKSEIYAMIGSIYGERHDTKDEIAALNSAIQTQDDPTLRLALGDAYRTAGDSADAVVQYQAASAHAYSDPQIHSQLETTFQKMGKIALANNEKNWMNRYMQSQKQANAGFGSQMPTQTTP
jgi:hypothetical protein